METMEHYIHRQAAVMKDAIEGRAEITAPFVKLFCEAQPDHLYLVGSGTSGNAVRAAAAFVEKATGVEVVALSPTSLPEKPFGRPLFVFVSQGGNSTNTLRAIESMRAYPSIALTGESCCRINEVCANVQMRCEHEYAGPKTMGYTCTIITLYLMAMEAARAVGTLAAQDYEADLALLRDMANAMDENVRMTEDWYKAHAEALKDASTHLVIGIENGRIVAQEGALKLQETILQPAFGYEFEEFLHGPVCMFSAAPEGFYLLPPENEADAARMVKVAQVHSAYAKNVWCVRQGDAAAWDGATLTYHAPKADFLTPFWQILPFQVLSAFLPAELGTAGKGHQIIVDLDKAVSMKYKGIM